MRTLLLALAFAATLQPARAESLWVGTAFVTEATSVCGSAATVGDFARLIYRPAGTSLGNDADSTLAYITSRASVTMFVPNNTFRANINYSGQSISSQVTITTRTGGILGWTLSPSVLATSTPRASLTARLANFFAVSGCTVSLQANLAKIP